MLDYKDIRQILFWLSPETAHEVAAFGLKLADKFDKTRELMSSKFTFNDDMLSQNLLGLHFDNPIGIGGGFDKNGDLAHPLQMLGFGYLEYGTFTPREQAGNPRPRLWRIKAHESIQNAMGFNNLGAAVVEQNIYARYPFKVPVFANIGKNKLTSNEDAINDYVYLAKRFSELCDAFVINISSPNTPNLRDLQNEDFLKALSSEISKLTSKPLILKIAPDMSAEAAISLCSTACELGFKGIIINNTSVDYSLYKGAKDRGGISGELIRFKSRELFEAVAKELFGKILLISCGGISSASEVLWRIEHGANLVQLFTGFIYKGPGIASMINKDLVNMLKIEGFSHISQAVGSALKK